MLITIKQVLGILYIGGNMMQFYFETFINYCKNSTGFILILLIDALFYYFYNKCCIACRTDGGNF